MTVVQQELAEIKKILDSGAQIPISNEDIVDYSIAKLKQNLEIIKSHLDKEPKKQFEVLTTLTLTQSALKKVLFHLLYFEAIRKEYEKLHTTEECMKVSYNASENFLRERFPTSTETQSISK